MQPNLQNPKLLDRLRLKLREKHYSLRTEDTYYYWNKRFILFHNKRHPSEMGKEEIEHFLTYLAVDLHVSSSTQTQAFSAILFLYRYVLKIDIQGLDSIRAKQTHRLPTVITHDQAMKTINNMRGAYKLMAQLLYGSGLRLMECVRLRIKDIDFAHSKIIVRGGKGDKDRLTLLPESVVELLKKQIESVKALHAFDLKSGYGEASMPDAIDRKYPNAAKELGWQYIFPASHISTDPRSRKQRRHHIHETFLQKNVKEASHAAGITAVTPHTFRHCFATEYLKKSIKQHGDTMSALETLRLYLGHNTIKTTMIYLHFVDHKVKSPLDD